MGRLSATPGSPGAPGEESSPGSHGEHGEQSHLTDWKSVNLDGHEKAQGGTKRVLTAESAESAEKIGEGI